MEAMDLKPWHILVLATAGWMNREQSAVVDYLKEENRVLRELLGKKRPRLNDDQRRRLAVLGKPLGRKLLSTCCNIVAPDPNGAWMSQVARNLTDCVDGFLNGKRYLIHDRDPLYTAQFVNTLKTSSVWCIKLPPKSPNLNAYAERFVRSIKSECLDRMIFFGGKHLWCVVNEYMKHYHAERNHQGIENRLIETSTLTSNNGGSVMTRTRVGGMLKYYYRPAA